MTGRPYSARGAKTVVLAVLEPAQSIVGGAPFVPVANGRRGERALEPHRVRPGVVEAPNTSVLAEVEQQPHAPAGELPAGRPGR